MIEASHPGMKKVIAMLIYYPVSGIIIELTG
jgi:hypothetical protein